MCELRFNDQSSAFEVAIRIFIDDLEKAIAKEGVTDLRIGTEHEDADANRVIAGYLDRHFMIQIDGEKLKANFLGKEMSEDMIAVWCYLEFPKATLRSGKCILANTVLLDIYDDQRNIMDIRMNKLHKDYAILEGDNYTWTYTFAK